MIIVILWLIQDLLTVFTGGGMQIPGLFILGVVCRILLDDGSGDGYLWGIWAAFAGGILWDLRWIGIPGFFTLGYVLVVLIVIQVWGMIPPQGRVSGTSVIVFVLLEATQLIPPMLPVLILGGNTGWGYFLTQQVWALPAILFTTYIYLRTIRDRTV
ncbi:MAG: hypothetical protein IJG37_10780, partial [Synergistaceae bacterium]|nr:hypothetical protein [Synergistaceae bacterium]